MRNIIGGQIGYDNLLKKNLNFLKKNYIYPNGRCALFFILKKIKKKVKTIYVPSYLCESILQPIRTLNMNYKFYEVKNDFRFQLPKENNSAIIFLNYFGKKNSKKIENLKNDLKKNIYYIQDCTHNVFEKKTNLNNFNKNNIFRFASIKKYIPFPIGGINNIGQIKLINSNSIEKKMFKKIFNTLKKRNNYFLKPNNKINELFEKDLLLKQNDFKLFENKKIIKCSVPLYLKKKLNHYDLKEILIKRDENYKLIQKKLDKNIKIVSKNINYPLNFTIFLKKSNKKKIISYFKKYRIFPTTLWPIPAEVKKKRYFFANYLNSRVLSFPIDHRYKKKDIEFMISIIHKAVKI